MLLIRFASLEEHHVDLVEQAPDAPLEAAAREREFDVARRAVEQLQFDRLFEIAHAAAHRRLREAELARSTREAA